MHKLQLSLNKNIIQPHRSQIYVGFKCTQKCGFCYYKSRCNEKMFEFDQIKKQIDFESKYGITDFEITGGEPSEHKQLIDICKYIKDIIPTSKIAIITNGGLAKIPIWDFIDEVLVSYHSGKNCFDCSMFPNGSTFKKVYDTIQLAKSNRKLVRTNTIIASFNAHMFDSIVDDLIQLSPNIVNILPINLFDESISMSKYIDYDLIKPIIKKSIDKLSYALPESLVLVRYIPFCEMIGYEKHIVGNLQRIYDWFDWNSELCGMNILRLMKSFNITDALKFLGNYGSSSLKSTIKDVNALYYKPAQCIKCKYLAICDGLENNVDEKYAHPHNGQLIFDIMHYIGTSIQDFYRKWYHE